MKLATTLLASAGILAASAAAAVDVKIGVLNDRSGVYADLSGQGSVVSAQMAVEWGPHGVRSNCISPGLIETALSAPFYAVAGVREQRERLVPLRKIGTPRHVADAALFLASDAAAYINGHNLVIDGGLSHALIAQVPRPEAA